jgi:hypothetical protein
LRILVRLTSWLKIEAKHMSILNTVLTQGSKKKLLAIFKKRGIYVEYAHVEGIYSAFIFFFSFLFFFRYIFM